MMKGRDVLGLKVYCALVVGFRLLVFVELVPAESTVVVSLEVIGVSNNCVLVVFDRVVELPLFPVSKPSVVVKICFVGFDRNGF